MVCCIVYLRSDFFVVFVMYPMYSPDEDGMKKLSQKSPCSCFVFLCTLGVLTPSLTFVVLGVLTTRGLLYSLFKV